MNIFERFWYTIFEHISEKSNLKDMPYSGTAFILLPLISLFLISVIEGWRNLSISFGLFFPTWRFDFSRMEWYAFLLIPLVALCLINKRIGRNLIRKFADEDVITKTKRKRETLIIIILDFTLAIGIGIWRACLL
jgi:hypothetical protein